MEKNPLDDTTPTRFPLDAFGRRIKLGAKVIFESLADDALIQGEITKISLIGVYPAETRGGRHYPESCSWRLTIMDRRQKYKFTKDPGHKLKGEHYDGYTNVDQGIRKKSRNMERPTRCMVLEPQHEFLYGPDRKPDLAAAEDAEEPTGVVVEDRA